MLLRAVVPPLPRPQVLPISPVGDMGTAVQLPASGRCALLEASAHTHLPGPSPEGPYKVLCVEGPLAPPVGASVAPTSASGRGQEDLDFGGDTPFSEENHCLSPVPAWVESHGEGQQTQALPRHFSGVFLLQLWGLCPVRCGCGYWLCVQSTAEGHGQSGL